MDAVFHVFTYLEKKHNSRLIFDSTYPDIDMGQFKECNWREFYGEVEEPISPNALARRGKEVNT